MTPKPVPGVQSLKGVEAKKRAGYRAADLVKDGMVIGLGTGSTVHFCLERLSARIENGLQFRGVPTSLQTSLEARAFHIPLAGLDEVDELDLAIDGADQVDANGYLIKGRGAAQTREKCVADAAHELVIVITSEKLSDRLTIPIPVEVIPFAWAHVSRVIRDRGGIACLREAGSGKDGPVITDNSNLVLDCDFGTVSDPPRLERELEEIPGVVGIGLFTRFAGKTTVIVGEEKRTRILSY
ncbi:MAG: ribose-5-phosphate isomerase RpiA [Methanomicrobiales archaeon]|nr:ribose-5-phosphate isomerase RpiA [Methanomicrobiales archaeon]